MLICLSSDARLRYKEDIVRAVTMPSGMRLLLRYRLDWIPEGMRKELEDNKLKGQGICIAHLETRNSPNPPKAVPCRDGTIVRSYLSGNAVFIEAELGDFWSTSDPVAFTKELSAKTGTFPYRSGESIAGNFVLKVDAMPNTARKSAALEDWEAIASALRKCTAFAEHPYFYFVRGLFPLTRSRFWSSDATTAQSKAVEASNGRFTLDPDVTYSIVVRSEAFSLPGEDIPHWLLVNSDEKLISFSTAKHLSIDSPYDEKQIHFRSSSAFFNADSSITFLSQRQKHPHPDPEAATLDFDLYVTTNGDWRRRISIAVLLGSLLSGQGMYLLSQTAGRSPVALEYLGLWVLGVLAGAVASFGLRKL